MMEQQIKHFSTDERRKEIAAAATALIVEKGIEALRTREVAARVGINIATLHYHVSTKNALIHLVIDALRDFFAEQYQAHPRDGLSPLQMLQLEIQEYKEMMVSRPDLLQLMDEMFNRGRVDVEVEAKMREMKIRWNRQFVEILKKGKQEGQFRENLDPIAGAHMVTGALVAFQYKPKHLFSIFDAVADEIVKSFVK
ncbi:TetR/AcrR family transcriptional regulator [Rhizobium sp. L1K21]|uniref:TetR/AcrR family transcriptional regulator n=1 Tax=Rhizobium sp. L1K21 TaxID=2954933 RepID=UPI0020935472|nr:TetR/AcrR family transcriptional regulator [Rhizobium sp. L1K21]MCO6185575.1 TetR/AcrR family transcriptional regulator [Rhizobium sp. L1K21]